MRRPLAALIAALLFLPAAGDPTVSDWIERLGSDEWKAREEATFALMDLGEAAVPALREAAQSSDPEVKMRATEALRAIEVGFGSKAYREFGPAAQGWKEMPIEQRRALAVRLAGALGTGAAKPIARLSADEADEALRTEMIGRSIDLDAAVALAELERQLAAHPDGLLTVRLASHWRNAGQPDRAADLLDRLDASVTLPPGAAREVAGIHAAAKRWKRAADAFALLKDRAPTVEEADMAGARIAYLRLAGEGVAAEEALKLALGAEAGAREPSVLAAVDRLEQAGAAEQAAAVAEAGVAAGVAGRLPSLLGRLLLAAGRELEAMLAFRRAVLAAPDDAALGTIMEELRRAYERAGEPALATETFVKEMKAPEAAARRHAEAARALEGAAQPALAAIEWKKVSALMPGEPGAAAAAARCLRAAGDPRAARWEAAALAWGAAGWGEEALMRSAAPAGGRVRPVARRAVELESEGTPMYYAVAGEIAAVADGVHRSVTGVRPDGTTAWTWKWTEAPKQFRTAVLRTRSFDLHALVPTADAFVVAVAEHDTVTSGMGEEHRYAGEWLVVLDAATGQPRSTARHAGLAVSDMRPAAASGCLVVSSDPGLSILTATDTSTGTTHWVRLVDRFATATDPLEHGGITRLAIWEGLVLAPSPHGARVRAFRLGDGEPVWDAPLPGPVTDVRAAGGRVWAAAGNSAACLDAATGNVLWTAATPGRLLGAPAVLDGVAAARCADGWLRGFDAATGRETWKVFVGPAAGVEWVEAAGPAFWLLRRDAATWAVSPEGRPLRRFHLDFNAAPVPWNGALLADDTFGRRRPLHAPPGLSLTQEYANGLLRLDAAPILEGDAVAVARAAAGCAPDAARALIEAALQAIDPEDPELLLARARLPGTPEDLQLRLDDAWRALDALPPLSPAWDAAALDLERIWGQKLPLELSSGKDGEVWVVEQRILAALARLRRRPEDADAALALGECGVAGAREFLADVAGARKHNAACAIARTRLGDAAAVAAAVEELKSDANGLQAQAAEALRRRREPEVLEALRPLLDAKKPVRVRLAAALALAPEKAAGALDVLETFGLPSDDRAVMLESASLLFAAGRPARAADALARADDPGRGSAGFPAPYDLLASCGAPEAVDRLESLATTAGGNFPAQAAASLLRRHPDRAHAAIAAAMEKGAYDKGLERRILPMLSPGEHPACAAVVAERAPKHLESPTDVDDPGFRLLIADALDMAGKGAEARRHMDFYASLCPDTSSYCNNAAWFMAIARSPEMSDGPAAVALALRAVEGAPDTASYWDTLAEALREAGLYDAAVGAALRAAELAPLDGESCDLAYCVAQLRKFERIRANRGGQ